MDEEEAVANELHRQMQRRFRIESSPMSQDPEEVITAFRQDSNMQDRSRTIRQSQEYNMMWSQPVGTASNQVSLIDEQQDDYESQTD